MVIIEGGCLLDSYPEMSLTARMSKPIENEMGGAGAGGGDGGGSRKFCNSEDHLKKSKLSLPVNIMLL